ncbi:flagellar biosynthesis anti-sigma factor FlgM [Bordetella pseudohinzii]|uniref:Negative regulator of flagellin synthesis n=1 Tax=Bordetella pseudohinzii TaxID=1331258 RepID=A0A0J6BZE8_9BORD|nr:flagellar biosynthesis anti-sigma factor FlgM [Bordetella pseudohinzii]ANY15977.1 flagellar biosynthesis anti-sigma factor FlgM [Bordetella pseudohinzii]KMM23886.1 flagellar biosynthesis anti-sigma factor FlgM [Bordetella pseudohinzii]KXA75216.1 flagellar biosynthesis anti-sigma factor FlgM [Bordetella pseudohinzii]KXA75332.1 flagellar biosynthesis anti-sigma factor FlgM [Bordetella pseudohinzii]CUJ19363.1 Anti-sigma-28 factor [Bordetella pseudohinzii]
MKINTTLARPVAANPVQRSDGALGQAYGAGGSNASSAQVALSGASRQLLALQEGGSDIDIERVAAIRAAIASGQLRIDPSRIADSLIASAKELIK